MNFMNLLPSEMKKFLEDEAQKDYEQDKQTVQKLVDAVISGEMPNDFESRLALSVALLKKRGDDPLKLATMLTEAVFLVAEAQMKAEKKED